MDEMFTRFVSNLVGRVHGPMTLRLVLQPLVAILLATRDGMRDGRENRPAYFWSIFTRADERRALLHDGWKAMSRPMLMGAVMDGIYQLITVEWIYPLELFVVVLVLAVVPYI